MTTRRFPDLELLSVTFTPHFLNQYVCSCNDLSVCWIMNSMGAFLLSAGTKGTRFFLYKFLGGSLLIIF